MSTTANATPAKNKNANKKKPLTKAQLVAKLATDTGLTSKQVSGVLNGLAAVAVAEVKRCGAFTVPGLTKLVAVKKPATKEKMGINPFTKQEMTIKAKPARVVAKARVLKAVKDAVAS